MYILEGFNYKNMTKEENETKVIFRLLEQLLSYEIYKTKTLKIDYDYKGFYNLTFKDKSNHYIVAYRDIPENYCCSLFKQIQEKEV